MPLKFNTLKLGLIAGIVFPVIAVFGFYYINFRDMPFTSFISQAISRNVHTQLISLCVVPNLLLFFIFIWRNLLYSARGVLFATILYTFVVFGIKFLN